MPRAVGIDLGTTNSVVSALEAGEPVVIPNASAQQLDPKVVRRLQGSGFKVFQLDATAFPGNSGSPVWHPDTGEVLGVLNSVYVKGAQEAALSAPSGISYAIPVKHVHSLLQRARPETR